MKIICKTSFFVAIIIASAILIYQKYTFAQTIREKVKQHVEENLEKASTIEEQKPLKKKAIQSQTQPTTQKKKTSSSNQISSDNTGAKVQGTKKTWTFWLGNPDLPKRVIHRKFQLDLEAGGGYRGWLPQQYPTVSVYAANYFTWHVEVRARLFEWLDLSRGYYETTNVANPRPSEFSSAANYGSYALTAAWFLISLGFPVSDAWEPTIRYEARSFLTNAKVHSGKNVCIVPYNQSADTADCQSTEDKMSISSNYETALIGVNYFPSRDPMAIIHAATGKLPSFFFGAGYIGYVKPYQVTIGSSTLDEYLFTGRFRGGGIAFGTRYNGGVNSIFFDLWVGLGLGETRLTKDMTLNELAPEDWLIGYVGGNIKIGGRIAFWKFAPTLMFVPEASLGGASFFFFKIRKQEGEKVSTPTINWDILYTIRASLILTL